MSTRDFSLKPSLGNQNQQCVCHLSPWSPTKQSAAKSLTKLKSIPPDKIGSSSTLVRLSCDEARLGVERLQTEINADGNTLLPRSDPGLSCGVERCGKKGTAGN
jgi:hypothetical protein